MAASHPATPLAALDAVILDTETTGLDPRTARIVQIGAIGFRDGSAQPAEIYETLVNPGIPIPPNSTRIHQIADAEVANAPMIDTAGPELSAFIGGRTVIGHAVSFDLVILECEHDRTGIDWHQPQSLDVRTLAMYVAPERADHNLDRLCAWLGVTVQGRHTALGDALATAEVFSRLIPMLREKGIRTLAEALAASRQQADRAASADGTLPIAVAVAAAEPAMPALAKLDSFPYRHRVGDVMSAPPVFAENTAPLQHVIGTLIGQGISSVYVKQLDGTVGIVTERDVLRELNSHGATGLAATVGSIARGPLHSVSETSFIYRAIGRMDRLGVRHLGVHNRAGEIVGALTTRNLLRYRASTAIMLGDAFESARNAADLAAAWSNVPVMARHLIDDDVDPRTIAEVISSEIRMITRRAATLAEDDMRAGGHGPPPVSYAVMVLGSAGRGESLLAADQDNAIVYEDGDEGGPEDSYFEELASRMCKTLDVAGIPFCKGGVMAKNRAWRMSQADWIETINTWMRRQRPEDLLNVDIFFDGVAVHGNRELADRIRRLALETGSAARDFIVLLSEAARAKSPAFTLFGGFRKDEDGRLDLKKSGLFPLVTCARVLAIKHGIKERSTPARLTELAGKGIGAPSDIERMIKAHRTILGAMLIQQITDIEAGTPPTPKVRISSLSKAGQNDVRDALSEIDTAIDLVSEGRL